jgi:regulator of RNase E activity RraA
MYTLNILPPAIHEDDLNLLRQAEPATVGHFQSTGFMTPQIRSHLHDVRIAGTAITVQMPSIDGTIMHHAIGAARPGDVLVIDRCGESTTAAFGGAMAYAAKMAGVAGIIVDGYVTDLGELRQHGMPVWSRGPSPVTTRLLGLNGKFCTPICCGGIMVHPGDAILADENGILVLRPEDIRAAATQAIAFQNNEKNTLARLKQGEKFPDVVGSRSLLNDHQAGVAPRTFSTSRAL